jgi:hypothetical protein
MGEWTKSIVKREREEESRGEYTHYYSRVENLPATAAAIALKVDFFSGVTVEEGRLSETG